MRILLISPCVDQSTRTHKSMIMPQLGLHILAGLTPTEHQVAIVEEEIASVDLDAACDLVGLSCLTSNAPRAYALAKEFRKRGKTVVLGGVHPTILPDEALEQADSVVIGEAEGVWPRLLEDYQNGRLQRTYRNPSPSLETYVPIRYPRSLKKGIFHILPVMTTRGCPYDCDFCCVHDIFGKKIRHVPIENVVRYIRESGGKRFMFLDDNIVGDPRYASDLFAAVRPLKIKWFGQASVSFARDTGLLKRAAESGCEGLFFGLESVSESRLAKMRKSLKTLEGLEEAVKKIRSFGIYLNASVVFGFDEDTRRTFGETLDFLNKIKVVTATFNVLTPYPGSKIYDDFKRDNRIFTYDWKYYDHNTVVYTPARMTAAELLSGRLWARREFTRASGIIRRFPRNVAHPFYYLAVNLSSHQSCKEQLRDLPRLTAELSRLEGRSGGEVHRGTNAAHRPPGSP